MGYALSSIWYWTLPIPTGPESWSRPMLDEGDMRVLRVLYIIRLLSLICLPGVG